MRHFVLLRHIVGRSRARTPHTHIPTPGVGARCNVHGAYTIILIAFKQHSIQLEERRWR